MFLVVENCHLSLSPLHKILCIVLGNTFLETRQVGEFTSKDTNSAYKSITFLSINNRHIVKKD